jgi:hypothetical protein
MIPKIKNTEMVILMNNPDNKVYTNIASVIDDNSGGQIAFYEPEEDLDIKLYAEEDYFHKSPRFLYNLKPSIVMYLCILAYKP